ncbi:MAG: hypothetical protein M1508_00025 [Nitrospirae bacterium]|nr:hypothetical protein [Nitrospirota bacterium]
MKIKTYRNLAAFVEAVAIIGLPFLRINGEGLGHADHVPEIKYARLCLAC